MAWVASRGSAAVRLEPEPQKDEDRYVNGHLCAKWAAQDAKHGHCHVRRE